MAKDVPLVVQGIIISGAGPSRNATRQTHFLLPRAERANLPAPPLPPRGVRPVRPGELRVEFKGWPVVVPELWKVWVGKLRLRHETLWRELGIFHAILATTFPVAERDDATLLQLAAFWSGSGDTDDATTNTFVFPWGEATVTLEDVAVLAGLPLLGDPVCKKLYGGDRGDVGALEAVRASLCQSSSWSSRASHAAWAKHFSELPPEDEVLEHEGFLAMWFSLFVLPAPPADEVRPELLSVAARLARGGAVALAPAALASIYADLSALRRHIVLSSSDEGSPPFAAWAPLHVLQLWVWERFPELRPETAARPTPPRDVPRAVRRWEGARSKVFDAGYIHAVLMSPAEFEWAPYGSSGLAPPPGLYDRREIARRRELRSFAHCLRACELVGMGGRVELYCPHRVARQLGYDQDVPGGVARASSDWFAAWAKYKIGLVKFSFVVPDGETMMVTAEYEQWWEPCSKACAAAVAEAARVKVAALSRIAGNVNDIMPGWVRSGTKRTTLRRGKNVSHGSSGAAAAAILMECSVAEPASASVAEREPSKSMQQQSKEDDAPQPVITTTLGEQNSIPEQAHRLVQQTQPGATASSLLNPRQPVSTGNCEQGNTVLQAAVAEAARTKVAALSQSTGNMNDLMMPGWVRSGAKRTALRKGKKVSRGSSGAAAILMGAVREPASASVAEKEPSKSLQQRSKELVTTPDEQNCIPEQAEALTHRPVRQTQFGTTTSSSLNPIGERQPITTGNNEQGNTVLQADRVKNSCVSELVAALEDLTLQQGLDGGVASATTDADLLLAVAQETQQWALQDLTCAVTGEEGTSTQQMESLMKYLAEANENRSGNGGMSSSNPDPVLNVHRVQKYCVSQITAILKNLTLQQEQAGVAEVTMDSGFLQETTEETPTRDVTGEMSNRARKAKFSSLGGNNKGTSNNISSPNQQMKCGEANKKRSGNGGTSSSSLVGENTTALDSTEVCTKTIYYLSRFDRTKEAWAKDAVNQDPIEPKRAVGTMEMIKKASAIRQAECAELKKKILKLAEEIRELEAAEEH